MPTHPDTSVKRLGETPLIETVSSSVGGAESGGSGQGIHKSLAEKKAAAVGTKRLVKAFFYSMEGLASTWVHEEAFRQEMLLALVLIPTAILLPVSYYGKAIMIGSVLLVLIVELLNSGLEWCVDLAAQQQRHPFAKRAKDMGSAAVFLSLVNCLMMWGLVLGQAYMDGRLVF